MWTEGLKESDSSEDRITFHEYKLLMKGQPNDTTITSAPGSLSSLRSRSGSTASRKSLRIILEDVEINSSVEESSHWKQVNYQIQQQTLPNDNVQTVLEEPTTGVKGRGSSMTAMARNDSMRQSSIVFNKNMYRKNREMRLSVLEASKRFDIKRNEKGLRAAGLIMKRGVLTPAEIEDVHNNALFGAAVKRCGRCKTRNKTVSDVTGLLDNIAARGPLQHPL
jgi:hypothetical protein